MLAQKRLIIWLKSLFDRGRNWGSEWIWSEAVVKGVFWSFASNQQACLFIRSRRPGLIHSHGLTRSHIAPVQVQLCILSSLPLVSSYLLISAAWQRSASLVFAIIVPCRYKACPHILLVLPQGTLRSFLIRQPPDLGTTCYPGLPVIRGLSLSKAPPFLNSDLWCLDQTLQAILLLPKLVKLWPRGALEEEPQVGGKSRD